MGRNDPDHDAVLRIGSEAPRRRAHSAQRHVSHGFRGTPPPRTVIGDPSPWWGSSRNRQAISDVHSIAHVHHAGRMVTPSGTTPSRTSRPQSCFGNTRRHRWCLSDLQLRNRAEGLLRSVGKAPTVHLEGLNLDGRHARLLKSSGGTGPPHLSPPDLPHLWGFGDCRRSQMLNSIH